MDGRGLGEAMAAGMIVMCAIAAVVGWGSIEGIIWLVKWIIAHVRFV